MPLKHTEPEYTMEELKILIKNEIEIDNNKIDINSFIEFIGNNERNINAKSNVIISITNVDVEERARKIREFLDVDEFIKFVKEDKIKKSSFNNSESQELVGDVSIEDVINGLKHSYDEDMRSLKKR